MLSRSLNNIFKVGVGNIGRMACSTSAYKHFETLKVSQVSDFVYNVELNRPEKRNAMNGKMWTEIGQCFRDIGKDENCRSVLLSGSGKHFCSGLDIADFQSVLMDFSEDADIARKAFKMRDIIKKFQSDLSAIEECRKPVIAVIQGYCIGGAIDMSSTADIRYCTSDAIFHIKEVELGIAADTGTVQRLSKASGNGSLFRELVFAGAPFDAKTASQLGFVSRIFPDYATMKKAAELLAIKIAEKSPVAVQTAKESLNYSRDHTVAEGLDHVANWNMVMLQTEDLPNSVMALMSKTKGEFAKL